MDEKKLLDLFNMMTKVFKPHPWHGIELYQDKSSNILNAFIEMVPSDTVKYELDKDTGYLKVDRPQKYSNIIPALYGFLPKTYCDSKLAEFTIKACGRPGLVGDKDPLDICVLTEKHISHGDLLCNVIPIGGFRMLDNGEVDDKILAVLKGDAVFGGTEDVADCPAGILARLKHYFLTYKQIPGDSKAVKCEITHMYGKEEALQVIELASQDYHAKYNAQKIMDQLMGGI